MRKSDYPKAIADLLGIPPVPGTAGPWMSNEGTVIREWLEAVGEVLDLPYSGRKTLMMQHIIEAAGGEWDPATMSSDLTESSGQGNITKPAFETLHRLLVSHSSWTSRLKEVRGGEAFEETPPPGIAQDKRVLQAIRVRAGQPKFREGLLRAYGGRCAVSDCDAPQALEAAHVIAYADGGTYDTTNGLLLRADLHTLFDMRRLAFDDTRKVLVHHSLEGTVYESLKGTTLRDPHPRGCRVSDQDLAKHRATTTL